MDFDETEQMEPWPNRRGARVSRVGALWSLLGGILGLASCGRTATLFAPSESSARTAANVLGASLSGFWKRTPHPIDAATDVVELGFSTYNVDLGRQATSRVYLMTPAETSTASTTGSLSPRAGLSGRAPTVGTSPRPIYTEVVDFESTTDGSAARLKRDAGTFELRGYTSARSGSAAFYADAAYAAEAEVAGMRLTASDQLVLAFCNVQASYAVAAAAACTNIDAPTIVASMVMGGLGEPDFQALGAEYPTMTVVDLRRLIAQRLST
jgi:hypothetical protein